MSQQIKHLIQRIKEGEVTVLVGLCDILEETQDWRFAAIAHAVGRMVAGYRDDIREGELHPEAQLMLESMVRDLDEFFWKELLDGDVSDLKRIELLIQEEKAAQEKRKKSKKKKRSTPNTHEGPMFSCGYRQEDRDGSPIHSFFAGPFPTLEEAVQEIPPASARQFEDVVFIDIVRFDGDSQQVIASWNWLIGQWDDPV